MIGGTLRNLQSKTIEGQVEKGLYGNFIVNFLFMTGGTQRNLQSSSRPCQMESDQGNPWTNKCGRLKGGTVPHRANNNGHEKGPAGLQD